MDLAEQIEIAARDLPAGYIIKLGVENGSAWVELFYGAFESEVCAIDCGGWMSLAQQVQEAIDLAIKHNERRITENGPT